jgi:hypothetical protein
MGIAWAASERQKRLLMNIKTGNREKKEKIKEKCPVERRNTKVKSS